MGRTYYYFAASLPMIHWDGKLPLTCEEFLSDARRLLSGSDFRMIEQLLKDDDSAVGTGNAAALAWTGFQRHFRNEIAWFRAHQAHQDPFKSVRGTKENEPFLREAVHEASRMPDLLEAQRSLDRVSWEFLDDLSSGHYYDLEFLICYGLKLRILERHHQYRSSKGAEAFEAMKTMELPVDWAVPGV